MPVKIEEVARLLDTTLPVLHYYEANYGQWVFHVAVSEDTAVQVRIRKFPRTKMQQCMEAIAAAVEAQLTNNVEEED